MPEREVSCAEPSTLSSGLSRASRGRSGSEASLGAHRCRRSLRRRRRLKLRVLGQSNARVSGLGTLQLRAATYQEDPDQSANNASCSEGASRGRRLHDTSAGPTVGDPSSGHSWTLVVRPSPPTLGQLAPATNRVALGSHPRPPEPCPPLEGPPGLPASVRGLDGRGRGLRPRAPARRNQPFSPVRSQPPDNDLGAVIDEARGRRGRRRTTLIAKNRSAYTSSRNLFVAVGSASIALALLLGFLLSWSVSRPIQQTDERLAEIASGDFSKHVDVPNRDELGALAANLNRMNDELGRLYEQLESQAAELVRLNRTLEARVRGGGGAPRLPDPASSWRPTRREGESSATSTTVRNSTSSGSPSRLRLARELFRTRGPQRRRQLLEGSRRRHPGDVGAAAGSRSRNLPAAAPGSWARRCTLSCGARVADHRPRCKRSDLGRYPPDVESTVYFCCLEALQNAAKHEGGGSAAATVGVPGVERRPLLRGRRRRVRLRRHGGRVGRGDDQHA